MEKIEKNKRHTSDYKQYVIFKLGEEEYGVDILKVSEIVTVVPITRVPKTPRCIKGVINLRGNIIPVMELREKLGLKLIKNTEDSRIIIFNIEESSVGIIVESVTEVIELSDDSIQGISAFNCDCFVEFLSGMGKLNERIIPLLNIDQLILSLRREL